MKKHSLQSFIHLIKCFIRKMSADKLDVYSAQSSFFLIMGIIPMLMLMLMLLRFTPLTEKMILEVLSEFLDKNVMSRVAQIVRTVYHGSVGIVSFATISCLWLASKAIRALIDGLNSIRRVRESRNIVILIIRSLIYTAMLIVTFVVALAILVAGFKVSDLLMEAFPILRRINKGVRSALLLLVGMALMVLIFDLLYVVLPNGKRSFKSQLPGAVFTTLAWTIYTGIYSIYLSFASNLSVVYGGLASVMGFMLWLYYCIYIFFFGAEINEWLVYPDSFPF